MNITPLGTNGYIPTYGRQTMSYLVEVDGRALVLDAGTGLSRLLEEPLRRRLAAHRELDILLTHYHLDHVVGLSYLPAIWSRGGALRLWAPTSPLVDSTAEEALERLLSPPLFPVSLAEFPGPVEVRPYGGDTLELAGRQVRLRRQNHGGGSVGVSLEGGLAYLTDCESDEAAVPFARGAGLLLHEVWHTEEEVAAGSPRHGHSTVEEVADLARRARVATLMPVHHRPDRRWEDLEAMSTRLRDLAGCEVTLAAEGTTYTVPRGT